VLDHCGKRRPDDAVPFGVLNDLPDDRADRVGRSWLWGGDAHSLGRELAGGSVDDCTLDAGAAYVDAERLVRPLAHVCLLMNASARTLSGACGAMVP
jgi:hypothetical protein